MRHVLPSDKVEPPALAQIENFHATVIHEVKEAIEKNAFVIVGMAHNPFVGKAKGLLQQRKIDFKYLEYGSYFSHWKLRLALKLWSGWPTYPQVFINGRLVGGYSDLKKLLDAGKIRPNPTVDP